MRVRFHAMATFATLVAVCHWPASAQNAVWSVEKSRSGSLVGRLSFDGGPVRALEFACLGGKAALGVQPAAPTQLIALPIVFMGDRGAPVSLTLPRMGRAAMFGGVLPDMRLVDGLTGGWSRARAAAAGSLLEIPVGQAASTVTTALAACYTQPSSPKGTVVATVPGAKALPQAIQRDLNEFATSCTDPGPWDDKPRGHAVIAKDPFVRADFNGDGVIDYLLDLSKLRCSADESYGGSQDFIVYTSMPDGAFAPTFSSSGVAKVTLIAGQRPALHLHQVSDEEGDDIPDQTIRMVSATTWTPTKFGIGNWRLDGSVEAYPRELVALIDRWDKGCAAQGRELRQIVDGIQDGFQEAQRKSPTPFDFNGDGRRDYIVDAGGASCGLFSYRKADLSDLLPGNSSLIAVISRSDGSYVVQALPGSTTFQGNGDTAGVVRRGSTMVLTWPDDAANREGQFVEIEVRWTGTTQVRRRIVRKIS